MVLAELGRAISVQPQHFRDGRVELLARLYREVFIPEAVRDELLQSHPTIPSFIWGQAVKNRQEVQRLLVELDSGEAEAIILAKELKADEVLIDESDGRRVAVREGLHVIGLLGVLLEAKGRGYIPSVHQVVEELENNAGFRIAESVKQIILREAGEM